MKINLSQYEKLMKNGKFDLVLVNDYLNSPLRTEYELRGMYDFFFSYAFSIQNLLPSEDKTMLDALEDERKLVMEVIDLIGVRFGFIKKQMEKAK